VRYQNVTQAGEVESEAVDGVHQVRAKVDDCVRGKKQRRTGADLLASRGAGVAAGFTPAENRRDTFRGGRTEHDGLHMAKSLSVFGD